MNRGHAFVLSAAIAGFAGLGAAPPQSLPLIMENADHMEGSRVAGQYTLTGKVRFRHGDLLFETERAQWDRAQNRVFCEQGMRITNHGALLTADQGSYDKSGNQALARGNVFALDSSGQVNGTGDQLTYDRLRRIAVLTGNPVARRFYPAVPGDSAHKRLADTLTIRAITLRYNDSAGTADAEGDVVITRRDLRLTCGRAKYLQKQDSLYLFEKPWAKVQDSEIKGAVMRIGLKGETLRGLRVRGDAEALSLEKATDSTPARNSRVTGDSLFMAFREGAIESVQVFTKAKGAYWEVNKPQYTNRMSGDYMVLRFRDREARTAEVLGSAHSTYYHFERDTLKGRNLAQGDTIAFAFSKGKVEEALVRGSSQGVYEGTGLGSGKTVPGKGKEKKK